MSDDKDIRTLLIHLRKDDNVCLPERLNFLEHTGLYASQVDSINLCNEPKFDHQVLEEYDAFLVGGFSDDPPNYVGIESSIYPFIGALESLINLAIENRVPGILSCGGFMFASVLLGGKLTLDRGRREMDIVDVHLETEFKEDPLFTDLPETISIVSGHLKSTVELPAGTRILARSKRCPIHAFKVDDTSIYAFQGHPEITAQTIKERVKPYKDKYFDSEEEYLNLINSTKDTFYANQILKNFVKYIIKSR